MPRYIDADELLEILNERYEDLEKEYGYHDQYVCAVCECIEKVEDMPTADVKPIVRGEWKECEDRVIRCSICGGKALKNFYVNVQYESLYCPICGADMRGDKK